jgi:hypothetical protein
VCAAPSSAGRCPGTGIGTGSAGRLRAVELGQLAGQVGPQSGAVLPLERPQLLDVLGQAGAVTLELAE